MKNTFNIKPHFLKNAWFILLIIFFSFELYSQNVEFKKSNFPGKKQAFKEAKKSLKNGDKAYKKKATMQLVLDYYEKAYDFNPDNGELNYKMGICYMNIENVTKALMHLKNVERLTPNLNKNLYLQLARAYQLNSEFKKAIEYYEHFKEILNPAEFSIMFEEIQARKKECNYGIEMKNKPARVFIDNIGNKINTTYPEYTPIVNADETKLFFSSRRPNTTGGKVDKNDGLFLEDIYISYKKNNTWSIPQNPPPPLNSEEHDAVVGISPDGQKLLIYRGEGGGDIYECLLEGDNWTEPKRLPEPINSKYHETSASYSYDGRTLFFDSNRPGGYGGHDIYMATQNSNGTWNEPVNLGPTINTALDEESVFIHPDGKTLFFSSNGHQTIGGFDIFKSILENNNWSIPSNLGYPINTASEDKYFSLGASNRRGYYSSVKNDSYGNTDIYIITFLGKEKEVINNEENRLLAYRGQGFTDASASLTDTAIIEESKLTLVKGTIKNRENMPINAVIEIIDNETGEVIAQFKPNSQTGKYLLSLPSGKNYGMNVKADNFLFHSENFDVDDSEGYKDVEMDITMQEEKAGAKVALRNIFFNTGEWKLKKESFSELDRIVELMQEKPSMKIEVSGHTDNVGSMQMNLQLSKKRAKSVYNYLVEQGIKKERLVYKGYGYSEPIESNKTAKGRQKNRRTEIKILGK